MRTMLTAYSWGLALALTWAGCDLSQDLPLPRCLDGQGLGTDAQGNFSCKELRLAKLAVLPPPGGCPPGQTLGYLAGSIELSCLDKTPLVVGGLHQQINDLALKLDSVSLSLAQLEAQGSVRKTHYVGTTAATTTGRITSAGLTGLQAATALCAAEFGARTQMCTQYQLTRIQALGLLGPKDRIPPAWIYMPTWHNPGKSTVEPLSGLADNCGGYTTGDDTAGWTGMAVEWAELASGDVVFRWHGGAEAPCSALLPIACCLRGL